MPLSYIIYLVYCMGLLLASALTGCLLVRKTWQPWYKWLVALCCVTFLVEMAGIYSGYIHKSAVNFGIYNVWTLLEPMVILSILSREATRRWVRRLINIFLIVLPPAILTCFILSQGISTHNKYADLLALFAELVSSCAILIDMLQDVSDTPLFARPMFWLSTGMLFYSSIFTVIYSLSEWISTVRDFVVNYYVPFSYASNTFMYGGFIACFLTLRKNFIPSLDSSRD